MGDRSLAAARRGLQCANLPALRANPQPAPERGRSPALDRSGLAEVIRVETWQEGVIVTRPHQLQLRGHAVLECLARQRGDKAVHVAVRIRKAARPFSQLGKDAIDTA